MLVVISSPVPMPREAECFNRLFEAGLEVLHVRKPKAGAGVFRDLLQGIDLRYYGRLTWHQHHAEGETWGMQRIHLPSIVRQQTPSAQLDRWKALGKTISTSIHSPEEYRTLSSAIDYALLGPVFPSISKPGYRSTAPLEAPARASQTTKRIAIGGLDPYRCEAVYNLGFDGIAALGSIWQQGDPVQNFKQLQEAWYIHAR
ncbi:thiamine phosphate synthase [Dawidia soli]|uniref:Thiamine phosphate synthase n=1 Tax=Dawidia soli TaxID=2782352 RepID=A0AAP2GEB2_9BACT|nr:thiamine phosphate synthase [Dawidia soli]MBT1688177.1 thiamine phosphate synthase [Dawidia soli]